MTPLDDADDPQHIELSLWIGGMRYRVDIVGGTATMADGTRWRLDELSALWEPRSEREGDLARLAATDGGSVAVAAETLLLLALADRRRLSGRHPGAMETARTAEQSGLAVPDGVRLDFAGLRVQLDGTIPRTLVASARSLSPALTADIVVADLAETGAWGARFAVNGVVRAFGIAADGATWRAVVQLPTGRRSIVEVGNRAVAVSRAAGPDSTALTAKKPPRRIAIAWAAAAASTAWQAQVIADSVVGLDGDAVKEVLDNGGALGAVVLRNDGRTVEYGIFS